MTTWGSLQRKKTKQTKQNKNRQYKCLGPCMDFFILSFLKDIQRSSLDDGCRLLLVCQDDHNSVKLGKIPDTTGSNAAPSITEHLLCFIDGWRHLLLHLWYILTMIWTKNVKFHHSRRHVATNYQSSSCVIRHSSEFFVPNSLNGFLTANLQLKPFLMRLEQFTVNASTDGSVESFRSCIMSLLSIMWTQLWIITWARCLFLVLEWLTGWCQVALQTTNK